MTKTELVNELFNRQTGTNLSREVISLFINDLFKVIYQEVTPTNSVKIKGYGTFYIAKHKATTRKGTYGASDINKGYYILKFKASKELREELD